MKIVQLIPKDKILSVDYSQNAAAAAIVQSFFYLKSIYLSIYLSIRKTLLLLSFNHYSISYSISLFKIGNSRPLIDLPILTYLYLTYLYWPTYIDLPILTYLYWPTYIDLPIFAFSIELTANNLTMTGFEPRISGTVTALRTDCAPTTALVSNLSPEILSQTFLDPCQRCP